MSNFCTACGARLPAEAKFCPACGAPVATASIPSTPEPKPAAAPIAPPETPQAAPPAQPSRAGRRKGLLIASLAGGGVLLVAILLMSGPSNPPSTTKTTATVTVDTPSAGDASATIPPAPPAGAAAVTAKRWEHYTNTRYGVSLDYPADLFAIQPPPPDNAGRSFEAKALKARFHVYSHANALDASVDELQAEDVLDIGDANATKRKGTDWYQVIGRRDGDLNGEHIIRLVVLSEGNTMVHRLEIAMPAAISEAFEPIATRMVRSLRIDPSIPEKAAANAGSQPATAAPATTATSAPPATERAWQTIDSLGLGLQAHGARKTAGVSLQIPADWQRVALPEKFLLEYAPRADGGKLRLLIEALRVPTNIPLAREAEAIKSTIKPGVENYQERNETDTQVARRPARRLTLIFKTMDEPYLLRQQYLLVRAGGTVFKILVQGPDAEAAAIDALFAHVVATLAVAG